MRLKLTYKTREIIKEWRRVYGIKSDDIAQLFRKALREHESSPIEYKPCRTPYVGKELNLDIDTCLDERGVQGLLIAYLQRVFESTTSRRQYPLIIN